MKFLNQSCAGKSVVGRFSMALLLPVIALAVSLTCAVPAAFASTYNSQSTRLADCFAEHPVELADSFNFSVSAPASLGKAIPVHVQGHSFNGAKLDAIMSLEPGKTGQMKCEPGVYSFSVDAADVTTDEIVCKSSSKTYVFLGQSDARVTLSVVKDEEATQSLLDAKKRAEEERAAAEAKAAEEKAAAEKAAAEQAAAEQASRQSSDQQSVQNNTATVYVTKTGECYHRDGCSSLKKSKIPISKSEAEAKGYRPCKNCRP